MATAPYPLPYLSAASYPPLYPDGYGSAPPTHPYPVPFLPHPCYQIHAPPAELTPPHTTVPPTTVQRTTHPLLPASDFSPPPPLAPTPPAPTREHPQPHPALHTSASKVAAAQAQAQAAEEEQIRARLPREVLNTNRRLDHLQHSFDLLQSHASRLKEMVAQIVAALGKQPAPGTAPNSPAPSPKPATTTQSAASVSNEFYGVLSLQSSLCGRPKQQQDKEGGSGGDLTMGTNSSGTSINGKKPIDKQPGPEILSMDHFAPTPSSVLDLDKSYGWQSEIQQGNTSGSPALPVFDEMPIPSSWQGKHGTAPNYSSGHHNQIQSSCVSNLSEQNLEMPQSYGFNNLKRGTVFLADGSEHSFYMLPEDYPLERATHDPVFDVYADDTEGCSSKYVDVFADTPGQQIYEEEAQRGEPLLTCLSKALETEHTSASVNITSDVRDFPLELQQQSDEKACNWPVLQTSGTVVTSSNQLSIEHSMRELRLLWDPGASTPLHPSKSTPSRELSYVAIDFPKVLNLCNQVGTHVLQLRDPRWNLLVVPEIRKEWDPGDLTIFSSVLNKDIFGMPTTVAQQSYYSRVPPRQESRGIQFEWDPGILSLMDMMLGKTAAPNRVHSSRTPCTLVILVGQSVDLNQFCDQLLQCHFWCHTPNAFLKVQYWCLPSVLDCSYLERDQHLVCYSHMLSSTETTLPVRCMSTAATVGMQLVLKSGKVAQEGRDASVVQLPVKINCHIWDPGIDSLLFLRKLLHIHLIQLLDNTSTTTYACYFLVDARLPPSQVAAYCPSNITVGEVTLRYFVFHPNLIGSGASTASNGITSSEYVYPLDFLHDPWEFFNQQAVNKSYSEKKVLSSANYFQILEMDIIFITYLPP